MGNALYSTLYSLDPAIQATPEDKYSTIYDYFIKNQGKIQKALKKAQKVSLVDASKVFGNL